MGAEAVEDTSRHAMALLKQFRSGADARNRMVLFDQLFRWYSRKTVEAGRLPAEKTEFRRWVSRRFPNAVGVLKRVSTGRCQVVYLEPLTKEARKLEWKPPPRGRRGPTAVGSSARNQERFLAMFGVTQAVAADRGGYERSCVSKAFGFTPRSVSVEWACEFARRAKLPRNKVIQLLMREDEL